MCYSNINNIFEIHDPSNPTTIIERKLLKDINSKMDFKILKDNIFIFTNFYTGKIRKFIWYLKNYITKKFLFHLIKIIEILLNFNNYKTTLLFHIIYLSLNFNNYKILWKNNSIYNYENKVQETLIWMIIIYFRYGLR